MTRYCYPFEVIMSALDQLSPMPIWGNKEIPTTSKSNYTILRPFLPYLLHSLKKWDNDWIVLNRDYKPLGLGEGSWVNYEDYELMRISKYCVRMDDEIGEVNPLEVGRPCYFFYKDGNPPRSKKLILEYIARVRRTLNI